MSDGLSNLRGNRKATSHPKKALQYSPSDSTLICGPFQNRAIAVQPQHAENDVRQVQPSAERDILSHGVGDFRGVQD